jgi:hypothetical protein
MRPSSISRFSGLPVIPPSSRTGFWPGGLWLLALLLSLSGGFRAEASQTDEQIAAVKAQMNDAIFKVQDIVNQPVTQLKRTPLMHVAVSSPGWFHAGAETPDFNTVDVRTTQQFPYDDRQYVTSDLNPRVVFLGHELEFNSMTKYFITDRTVPKKRLTEAEMVEINRLYRIIGHCEQQLNELQNPEPLLAKIQRGVAAHKPVVVGCLAAVVLMLLWLRKRQTQTSD